MSDYLPRLADPVYAEMVRDHTAVLVAGPRSCGKTTTAQRLAADQLRLGLDRVAAVVRADPASAIRDQRAPLLIDEWQVVSAVLGVVKDQVDRDPRRGQFILTGSARGEVDHETWPGTGRLVRLAMHGLVEREIERRTGKPGWLERVIVGDDFRGYQSEDDLRSYVQRALRSGFPEPALRLGEAARLRWLQSYVEQLTTRDVEAVGQRRDPIRLRRYLEALALHSAGVVDDTTLWQAAHVNKATAAAYDALLGSLFVTTSAPAWTPNSLKRLVLTPKRFLIDPGLIAGVLRVGVSDVMSDAKLLGSVIETFVAAQLRAELALAVPVRQLSHLRLPQGRREIDLIIELGPRRIVAIEVKANAAPAADDARHLRWLRAEFGSRVVAAVVLHTGPRAFTWPDGILALPISTLWD